MNFGAGLVMGAWSEQSCGGIVDGAFGPAANLVPPAEFTWTSDNVCVFNPMSRQYFTSACQGTADDDSSTATVSVRSPFGRERTRRVAH